MRDFFKKEQHIIVRGFLEESGRVLIIRASHAPALEYYELPGGYVEFGKDPADALIDIFFKETRIAVDVGAPFRTTSRMSSHGDTQTVEIVYRVRPREPFDVERPERETMLWIETRDAGYFLSSRITDTVRAALE